jgi:hypothetical protein
MACVMKNDNAGQFPFDGCRATGDRLFPLIYDKLRRMARVIFGGNVRDVSPDE